PHLVSAGKDFAVGINSWLQDAPRTWINRRVALYCHRIVGSIWDTRAQAQLVFAGRIRRITDAPDALATVVECDDLRGGIRDTTLFEGQWIGYVKSGVVLQEGDQFQVFESSADGVVL